MSDENFTFESRLLFLNSVFSNLYPPDVIMKKCISFKLGKSTESYLDELVKNIGILQGVDPMKLLNKINKS